MKRSVFAIFLVTAAFVSCLVSQGAFSGQDDSVNILVTVVDTPPQGTVVINNGDAYTNSASVSLSLSAWDTGSTVTEMQFSNDGVIWSSPEAYVVTKPWVLISGNGEKTVYAKFKDEVGNWSDAYSDMITLNSIVITTIDYSYDDLNRLENITHDGRSTVYSYDEVGNIRTKTVE